MNALKVSKNTLLTATLTSCLLLTACIESPIKQGSESSANTVATGSAGGATSSNANTKLEKCSESLGTISLVENQSSDWYSTLTGRYKLPPSASLLKLMIQQSNCFVVVERGAAGMRAISRERELEQSGELRKGSKFHKGQLVSSDYSLSPEINFSSDDTGGMSGSLGAVVGGTTGRILTSVGGGTKTREASVLLTMIDNRSSVQIAAAQGSASKADFGGFGSLFGSSAGGSISGYSNTPEGKILTAAFMDGYNEIVRSVRNYKAQTVKGGLGKGGKLKVSD